MRRRLDRAVAAFAFLSFLVATVVAGHRYFHCVTMDETSLSTCCPSENGHARSTDDAPTIDDGRCCDAKHFAALGAGFAESARLLLRAPFVALAADSTAFAPLRRAACVAESRDARAGPPVHPPRDYRIRLMISLT